MKAGFDLFDENEDKVLDLRETTNYMSSFFKVITSANPVFILLKRQII